MEGLKDEEKRCGVLPSGNHMAFALLNPQQL